jgi:DtxR family transcriptional regulator, Mn-dependent transcriptional regulator
MESERTEEYLEAIYKRQNLKTPVSTSDLADDLKVSAPAITDRLRQLKSQGLIKYRPNKGTSLTALGSSKALAIIRRHRLWERFLTDILGMQWDKVHEEACKLEHVASPEIERRLASILGNPDSCPHGNSIPLQDGMVKVEEAVSLSMLKPGQKATIIAIRREDAWLLRDLKKMNLRPGTIVTILENDETDSIKVKVNKNRILINSEIANYLMVKSN